MTTLTIRNDTTLVLEECCLCGVQFGLTDRMYRARRADKETFYCPNGHGQAYVKSEADKLRQQLQEAQARATHVLDQLTAERQAHETERKSHAATKGQLTKTRKRVAGGVCPCCNRSFVNLGRHMAGQHPDYAEAQP